MSQRWLSVWFRPFEDTVVISHPGVTSVELSRLQPSHSADDEVGLQPKTRPRPKRTGPKIVKF